MPGRFIIEGHAIVSADGAIADAAGIMPAGLRIEADWVRFQRRLDRSAIVVLGRRSHEAAANPGRRRLVITGAARGLERVDALTHRLDPAVVDPADALRLLVPGGGLVAVVGGTAVFDLFFAIGYDRFDLTVAERCRLPGGRPVFAGVASAEEAMARLAAGGLGLAERRMLDAGAGAVLSIFTRAATARSPRDEPA